MNPTSSRRMLPLAGGRGTGSAGSLMAGFLLLSQITSLWQLYLLYGGLVGVGMVFLGTIPANMLLANWFAERRGTAMGISQFGITRTPRCWCLW